MKEEIEELIIEAKIGNMSVATASQRILNLFAVSKRHLIENIIDDVKQSHSEYAVEKIESYLDDGC